MNRSKDIELFKLSIEKVFKKYGKLFFEMCGNPVLMDKVMRAFYFSSYLFFCGHRLKGF